MPFMHDFVDLAAKPCLNVSIAFVNPISGKNSIATMDKYPLFDEQGNVSGVASYAYECFDDVTISNCSDYLRPQVVGTFLLPSLITLLLI